MADYTQSKILTECSPSESYKQITCGHMSTCLSTSDISKFSLPIRCEVVLKIRLLLELKGTNQRKTKNKIENVCDSRFKNKFISSFVLQLCVGLNEAACSYLRNTAEPDTQQALDKCQFFSSFAPLLNSLLNLLLIKTLCLLLYLLLGVLYPCCPLEVSSSVIITKEPALTSPPLYITPYLSTCHFLHITYHLLNLFYLLIIFLLSNSLTAGTLLSCPLLYCIPSFQKSTRHIYKHSRNMC